ncbi:MAG: nicotinamide riboside transporter PnuC [Bacteroidales bacterium]|nr:nicotinamide riboside transporter PnuC [Bacteroidales bacterium]
MNYLEIFSLVTGVVFIIMQIFQHKWMWYFQIATALSAMIVAIDGRMWAFAILNLYFIAMAFLGIVRWKKAEQQVSAGSIHIARFSKKAIPISASVVFIGGPIVYFILSGTDDPAPFLDAATLVLSLIGSYWLTRSYLAQWFVWIVADTFAVVLNFSQSKIGLGILYLIYIISAIIGYFNWKKNGEYV